MLIINCDNEIDNSNMGNKTTNIYKQVPIVSNGHFLVSELNDHFANLDIIIHL